MQERKFTFLSDVLVAVASLDLEVPYSKRSGGALGRVDSRLGVGGLKGSLTKLSWQVLSGVLAGPYPSHHSPNRSAVPKT